MKETKQARFLAYFERKTAECSAKHQQLRQDGREDEAVFEKIRLNVFDVFRTVFQAGNGSEEFFRVRLEQIPSGWSGAKAAAEAHGDSHKAHIEAVKLEAVQEIRLAFRRIWEEEA